MDRLKKITIKYFVLFCIASIAVFALFQRFNIRDIAIRCGTRILPLEDRIHGTWLLEEYICDTTLLSDATILIGDSHLYYFQQYIPKNTNIINKAISGETTRGIISRDTLDLKNINNSNIILLAGYNDLKYRNVSQVCQNLDFLIHYYKENHLIVLSLFPVNKKRTWINSQIRQINSHLEGQCKRENITFINLYDELLNESATGLNTHYTRDGVHLNEKGYSILKKHLQYNIQ